MNQEGDVFMVPNILRVSVPFNIWFVIIDPPSHVRSDYYEDFGGG